MDTTKISLLLALILVLAGCQQPADNAESATEDMPPSAQAEATIAETVDALAPPSAEHADEVNNMVPADWSVRLDNPDAEVVIGDDAESSDIFFVNMSPGWHVTTGPAAIFYHPGNSGTGAYTAKAVIHLFDPGERREGYGMIIGGNDLDAENQSYDYFLLRNSGEYLIKRRTGNETSLIRDWTPHASIVRYDNSEEASVMNTMEVSVGDDMVTFSVNGQQVEQIPASEVDTEGLVGLRINHALNVHVSEISVTPAM